MFVFSVNGLQYLSNKQTIGELQVNETVSIVSLPCQTTIEKCGSPWLELPVTGNDTAYRYIRMDWNVTRIGDVCQAIGTVLASPSNENLPIGSTVNGTVGITIICQ